MDNEADRAKFGPQTVIGRLREYARDRHYVHVNTFGPSPFARIVEMKENAGIRGDGFAYDMIATEDDPEVTACRPDGGMADICDRMGYAISRETRCREMAEAIRTMPAVYREAIEAMYHVTMRERVRTFSVAAEKVGKPKSTYQLILNSAYGWLEGRLCLPVDRYAPGTSSSGQ